MGKGIILFVSRIQNKKNFVIICFFIKYEFKAEQECETQFFYSVENML